MSPRVAREANRKAPGSARFRSADYTFSIHFTVLQNCASSRVAQRRFTDSSGQFAVVTNLATLIANATVRYFFITTLLGTLDDD